MLSHVLRHRTETNTGEEINRESRILGIVDREHVAQVHLEIRLLESFGELLQSHSFENLLEHDFDEDTTRRGGVVLVHLDDVEDGPGNGVGRELMSEEASDVSKSVRFVSVNRVVVRLEALLVRDRPDLVELRESLSHESVELGVGSFLRATFDDHVAHFDLYQCPSAPLRQEGNE